MRGGVSSENERPLPLGWPQATATTGQSSLTLALAGVAVRALTCLRVPQGAIPRASGTLLFSPMARCHPPRLGVSAFPREGGQAVPGPTDLSSQGKAGALPDSISAGGQAAQA